MTDKLLYNLTIEVERGANIEQVEEHLEDKLLDMYDVETVEAIMVTDRTPPIDEDLQQILDVISGLESDEIRSAIDLVHKLEET